MNKLPTKKLGTVGQNSPMLPRLWIECWLTSCSTRAYIHIFSRARCNIHKINTYIHKRMYLRSRTCKAEAAVSAPNPGPGPGRCGSVIRVLLADEPQPTTRLRDHPAGLGEHFWWRDRGYYPFSWKWNKICLQGSLGRLCSSAVTAVVAAPSISTVATEASIIITKK